MAENRVNMNNSIRYLRVYSVVSSDSCYAAYSSGYSERFKIIITKVQRTHTETKRTETPAAKVV